MKERATLLAQKLRCSLCFCQRRSLGGSCAGFEARRWQHERPFPLSAHRSSTVRSAAMAGISVW